MARKSNLDSILSKWNALQPLDKHSQERLRRRFTIDFNYNSNHIEGNTLTYGQTELLLLFGEVVGKAKMKDLEDMKASEVGRKMVETLSNEKNTVLTETFIRQLHQTILREDYTEYRTLPNGVSTSYTIHAGRYKTRPNSVKTRYGDFFEYASPEDTPFLMHDLVEWYNQEEEKGELSPIDLAILFHYRYIRIHPFEDGNGRIARLLVNYILARHGYPMIVVRSRKKQEYLDALHKADLKVGSLPYDGAHARLDQIEDFAQYFTTLIADEIAADIAYVTEHEDNIWWHEGEYVVIRNETIISILRVLKSKPAITIREIADQLNMSKSGIQRHIKNLIEKGYIIAPQSNDDKWHVLIESSK